MKAKVSMRSLISKSDERSFYRRVLHRLSQSPIPFLVGGAHMLQQYSATYRVTKDLDIFVRPKDLPRTLAALGGAGYRTELCFPHWLAKVHSGEFFVDVIFNSGNGICEVDDGWFKHALEGKCFGVPVRFCPPEETIWSKAFIMERERFDGADIAHLFLAAGERIDWQRLLQRFGPHWRVLFSHLFLFGFIFPAELSLIPNWVMHDLLSRLQNEMGNCIPGEKVCQGTLLSRTQYVEDIEERGYKDARLLASGGMTPIEVARWNAAAADNQALK